jgi:hypothetical protein
MLVRVVSNWYTDPSKRLHRSFKKATLPTMRHKIFVTNSTFLPCEHSPCSSTFFLRDGHGLMCQNGFRLFFVIDFAVEYNTSHTYIPEHYPLKETSGNAASRWSHSPLSTFITDVFNSKRAEVPWLALFAWGGKKIGWTKAVRCSLWPRLCVPDNSCQIGAKNFMYETVLLDFFVVQVWGYLNKGPNRFSVLFVPPAPPLPTPMMRAKPGVRNYEILRIYNGAQKHSFAHKASSSDDLQISLDVSNKYYCVDDQL